MRFLGWFGSAWPFVLGLISAESAIGILSGPGDMLWKTVMLPGLFLVSVVDLAGIRLGIGWIPGRLRSLLAQGKTEINIFSSSFFNPALGLG